MTASSPTLVHEGHCISYDQPERRLYPPKSATCPKGSCTNAANHPLPDDGIIDMVAVEIVASGRRRVPLTRPERVEAAALIRRRGGSITDVAERLGVSRRGASRLLNPDRVPP